MLIEDFRSLPKQTKLVLVGALALILFVLFLLSLKSKPAPPAPNVIRFDPEKICDDAFDQHLDFSGQQVNHFDVKMTEGCFGGFITIPSSWHDWHNQPVEDQNGWWSAFWWENDFQPLGPFPANDRTIFHHPVHAPFRIQGHGAMRFYTNAASTPTQETKSNDSKPEPKFALLELKEADPHICEKPDDAFFAHFGKTIYSSPYDEFENPKFLFDAKHGDNVVNWTNGFKGTIPVCFIVDGKGLPSEVRFPHSPGKEFEDHLTDGIESMRFTGSKLKDIGPIRVQMAFHVVFR